MKDLDELFRDGLGDRKPEVPQDLWSKIDARRRATPSDEEIDQLFATRLAQRQPAVPAGMWQRILHARRRTPLLRYAALAVLLIGLSVWLVVAGTQEHALPPTATGPTTEQFQLPTPPADAPSSGRHTRVADATGTREPTVAEKGPLESSAVIPARQSAAPAESSTPPAASPVFDRAVLTVDALPPAPAFEVLGAEPYALPTPVAPPDGRAFRRSGGDRLELEFLAGAAYAHQSFGSATEETRELRNMREVSEFPQLSYQFSARLQYRLRPRWRVLTGLTYVEIRNQLEYETNGTGAKELIRSNNHLRMLEIPVLAGYVVSGRRLRLNVNAGPVINLFTAVNGQYIHPAFAQPRQLSEGTGYRSNIGLGWTASLTTTYLVGAQRTTQLLLEPFFKTYPGSFTTGDAPLSEHYWLAGLQVGLRKSF